MDLAHLDYQLDDKTYRLAYWTKGSKSADRILVCVHGLLRHSRDFDEIAERFAKDALVICPDLPGRGLSDWLDDSALYRPDVYGQIMLNLLERFPGKQVDWIGTSLGGLIGMGLAIAENSRIDRLVLNDIGPFLPGAALKRIADYIEDPRFDNQSEVTEYIKARYISYSGLNESQWQRLSRYGARIADADSGELALHYDPAIAINAREVSGEDVALWPIWEAIKQPVLLFHGLDSDLLTVETVEQMQVSHPDVEVMPLPGVAHAPSLMEAHHLERLSDWFGRKGVQ